MFIITTSGLEVNVMAEHIVSIEDWKDFLRIHMSNGLTYDTKADRNAILLDYLAQMREARQNSRRGGTHAVECV